MDDDPNFAVFELEGDPRIGDVGPAPDGEVVTVTDDDDYRERLEFHRYRATQLRAARNRSRTD